MKIRHTLGLIVAMMLASTAFADLSQYSTEELMEEVGRRIDTLRGEGGSGPSGPTFEVRFSCSSNNLRVHMTSQANVATSDNFYNRNGGDCGEVEQYLTERYITEENQGRYRGFLTIQVCNNNNRVTLRITPQSIDEVDSAYNNNIGDCYDSIGHTDH